MLVIVEVVVVIVMEVVVVIVNQGISHLSVFKSCMAAQCPVEIMFMKCSCSEVAGAVR